MMRKIGLPPTPFFLLHIIALDFIQPNSKKKLQKYLKAYMSRVFFKVSVNITALNNMTRLVLPQEIETNETYIFV